MTADRRLSIDAHLTLSIDGVQARLVGEGSDLTLRTDEPARLTAALRRSGALSRIRSADSAIAFEALGRPTVTVEGPRGPVVTVGAGDAATRRTPAPAGAAIRVHRPQDLVPRPVPWALAAAATLALALAVLRRRRG